MRARERSARIRRPLLAVIAAVATLIAMAGPSRIRPDRQVHRSSREGADDQQDR